MDLGIVGLTLEVPFVINFKQDVHFDLNLVPKDYRALFVTPAVRANVFPHSGLRPGLARVEALAISARIPRWSLAEPTRARPVPRPEYSRLAWDSM
jgi:hypothetical protein